MASDEEEDAYVAQLKEVFHSCDEDGIGFLNRDELIRLCTKLQLQNQREALVRQLMAPGNRARVGFEEFKERFVAVLSETVNDDLASTDGEEDLPEDDRPVIADHVTCQNVLNSRTTIGELIQKQDNVVQSEVLLQKSDITSPTGSPALSQTFESQGRTPHGNVALMSNDEGEHLREVWRQLGVGQDGALSLEELAIVCEHIGMALMSPQELKQLFDKLDVDRDGRVGIEEFLNGLFQHGSSTPASPPRQSLSNPRQKPQTSSTDVSSADVFDVDAGLFSALDPEAVGFAKPDVIAELWESVGVSHGSDILEYLQFSVSSLVNLSALSKALHEEVHHVEEDNAVYQAAIASYESELKHLRSLNEHMNAESEKFRSDLNQATNRISVLVAEGDERHSALERSRDAQLELLEKKHEKKLRLLQSDLEREREALSRQASKQSSVLQLEIDELKNAELLIKTKLAATKKEVEKLEGELSEMSEQSSLFETQAKRQAMELQSADELRAQLEEMESRTDRFLEEQQQMAKMEMHSLKEDNKDLKDRIDELMTEISDLRQQLLSSRRQSRNSKQSSSDSIGSLMSDYVTRETPVDAPLSNSLKIKRTLPPSPDENEKILQDKIENLERDKSTLEEEFRLRELELQQKMQAAVEAKGKELSQQFLLEKEDWQGRVEKEKETCLNQQRNGLQLQFEERLLEEKKVLSQQLSRDRSEVLLRENAEMEERMQRQKEALDLEAKRERLHIMGRFEEERNTIVDKHRLEIHEYENMLIRGVEGLQGQLKTDFFALLDRHRSEVTENERTRIQREMTSRDGRQKEAHEEEVENMRRKHEAERREILRSHELEITLLRDRLTDERVKLERHHHSQISDVEQSFEGERGNFERQRDAMAASHARDKSAWQRNVHLMKEELTDEVARSTRAHLEEEFVDQIDRIKNAYDAERTELEKRLRLQQTEVTQERQLRSEVEEGWMKGKQRVDELNVTLSSLRIHNNKLEELNKRHQQQISQLQEEPAAESEQTILRAIEQQKVIMKASSADLKDHVTRTLHHSLETKTISSENDSLQIELQEAQEKLCLSDASLQLSESSRVREVQSLRDQLAKASETADSGTREKLRLAEVKVKQLQNALEQRSRETNKLMSDFQRSMSKVEEERTASEKQLTQTKKLLDENVDKLRSQLDKSLKTDLLVKDLYVENAHLIKALEVTERRQRAAESKVFFLQDKNTELNKVVRMICPPALGS